jgi:hypothetical protein
MAEIRMASGWIIRRDEETFVIKKTWNENGRRQPTGQRPQSMRHTGVPDALQWWHQKLKEN